MVFVGCASHRSPFLQGLFSVTLQNPVVPDRQASLSIIFGQDQDGYGSDFQVEESFSGQMSGISFYERTLTKEEIVSLAKCRKAALDGMR